MTGIAHGVHAGCATWKLGGTGSDQVYPKLPGHVDCGLQTRQAFRGGRPVRLGQFVDIALQSSQAALADKLAVPSALLRLSSILMV